MKRKKKSTKLRSLATVAVGWPIEEKKRKIKQGSCVGSLVRILLQDRIEGGNRLWVGNKLKS